MMLAKFIRVLAVAGSIGLLAVVQRSASAADDPAKTVDVTAKVSAEVKDNKLDIVANNDLLGDPANGEIKRLRVVYKIGETPHVLVVAEDTNANIAAPAGQTLTITQAVYGVIDDAVTNAGGGSDVTAAVRNAVKNNALSISVDNDTLGGDPTPQVAKELLVTYSVNGSEKTISAKEGETLVIPAPADNANLVIVKAQYGAAVEYVDATQKVAALVKDGRLNLTADNDTFGDPAAGKSKQLKIEYRVGTNARTVTVEENSTVVLPTPIDGDGPLTVVKAVYGVLPPD